MGAAIMKTCECPMCEYVRGLKIPKAECNICQCDGLSHHAYPGGETMKHRCHGCGHEHEFKPKENDNEENQKV